MGVPLTGNWYYDWPDVAEHWIEDVNLAFPYTRPWSRDQRSVALWIIQDVFGLTMNNPSPTIKGGSLPGYDIKGRDAYQLVQLSLAEEGLLRSQPRIVEAYALSNGNIDFKIIGDTYSNISNSQIYYSFTSVDVVNKCERVMVTGYDPPPQRLVKGGSDGYNLFTFAKEYLEGAHGYDDPDLDKYPRYHAWGDWLMDTQTGGRCDHHTEGYIEYGDPAFDNEKVVGYGAIYDIKEFEQLLLNIYKVDVLNFDQQSTQLTFENNTPRFISIDDFGNFYPRRQISDKVYIPEYCIPYDEDLSGNLNEYGVLLPESEKKKFLGVKDVFIYGYRLNRIRPDEVESGDNTMETGNFIVDLYTMFNEPIRLSEGADYGVFKESDEEKFRLVFFCNVTEKYIKNFDKGEGAKPMTFKVSQNSIITENDGIPTREGESGVLRDFVTTVSPNTKYTRLVFPINEGQAGYVVSRIVVVYNWDNPCVRLFDSRGANNPASAVTTESLETRVKINFYPIVIKDEPAPIAVNGTIMDQSLLIRGPDPNSPLVLDDVPLTKERNKMTAGDINLVFPFATEDDCVKISSFILGLQNNGTNKIRTYICDPSAEPELGDILDGSIINSITYSYQDSSQYTISVQTGPMWHGMNSWEQSIFTLETERVQMEGVVTDVDEYNQSCTVEVNTIGTMTCINSSKDILEVGDVVQVTVYNNPTVIS